MATVVYTSGASNPMSAQVPLVIDLASTPLPVATATLYGAAEDTADPGATFTWQWVLAHKPTGSAAAFIGSSTAQNCVIGPIDTYGNYLLFLKAVSSGPGGASPIKYPLSDVKAFAVVKLEDATLGLSVPARYQRNVDGDYADLVDAVIQQSLNLTGQTIAQHSDVSSATGPLLDKLVDGSSAVDGVSNMHTHPGDAVAVSTTTTLGVTKLSDAPVDAFNPKALNNDRVVLSALISGYESALGYVSGQVGKPTPPGAGTIRALARFYVPATMTLESFSASAENGGSGSTVLNLWQGNNAAWVNGAPTSVSGTNVTLTPAADGEPIAATVAPVATTVNAGTWLGVWCSTEATTRPGPITVVISLLRKV